MECVQLAVVYVAVLFSSVVMVSHVFLGMKFVSVVSWLVFRIWFEVIQT